MPATKPTEQKISSFVDAQGVENVQGGKPKQAIVVSNDWMALNYTTMGRKTPEDISRIYNDADAGALAGMIQFYQDMYDKDDVILTCCQRRKKVAKKQPLTYNAEGVPADVSEFVEKEIPKHLKIKQYIYDAMDSVWFGLRVLRNIWREVGPNNTLMIVDWEPVDNIQINSETRRLQYWDEKSGDWKNVRRPEFSVMFYKGKTSIVSRGGIFRNVSWAYYLKHFALRGWAIATEVYGVPIKVVKVDRSDTTTGGYDPVADVRRALTKLGYDASIILDKEVDFKIEWANQSNAQIFDKLRSVGNEAIAWIILGQELTLKQKYGSQASAIVGENVEFDLTEDDCENNSDFLTENVIKPICGFKFGWNVPYPKAVFIPKR